MINNIKYFIKANRRIIAIIFIIFICSIAIAAGVYAQVTNRTTIRRNAEEENKDSYLELKNNFNDIFTNSINKESTASKKYNYDDIIYCEYDVSENESGRYEIKAKIPQIKLEDKTAKSINKEIYNTFYKKITNIIRNSNEYVIYNVDYVAYVNENIISLVIRCNYKNGAKPQREVFQTYNYDLEKNELLTIDDILEHKKLDKKDVQEKITKEIENTNIKNKTISNQGYNIYIRDENDEIYKVENTPNFFLGKNNYLYLVYAYGNTNYTSEYDLIIF